MATVLLINQRNEGVPIALHLAQQEGHIVKIYSPDRGKCLQGSKNPSFIGNPKRMAEQYDLVLQTTDFGERLLDDVDYCIRVIETVLPLPIYDHYEAKDAQRVVIEGWFTKEHWSPLVTLTIDDLRLMDGDRGCLTDGMGSVMVWLREGLLTERLLTPFTELFQKVAYEGPFSLEVYLGQEEKIWLGFIHPHYRYDHLPLTCELLREPLFTFLYQSQLDQSYKPQISTDVAMGARLSRCPWPLERDCSALAGIIDLEVPKEARPHVWLRDIFFEDEQAKLAGCDACLGFVTARGSDVQEARRRVYRTIGNIVKTKDVQYRSDIGLTFGDAVAKLKTQGWLN
ncbi:MAG: hypothetical protein FJW69_09740 [Actinobacteria bacterium]|nr:hypothetical protein [Actinomycetota bacterium]